jgi:hypothetical protein
VYGAFAMGIRAVTVGVRAELERSWSGVGVVLGLNRVSMGSRRGLVGVSLGSREGLVRVSMKIWGICVCSEAFVLRNCKMKDTKKK